jgi:hypothetical protein
VLFLGIFKSKEANMKNYLDDLFYFCLLFIAVFGAVVGIVGAFNILFPKEAEALGRVVWNAIDFVLTYGG